MKQLNKRKTTSSPKGYRNNRPKAKSNRAPNTNVTIKLRCILRVCEMLKKHCD